MTFLDVFCYYQIIQISKHVQSHARVSLFTNVIVLYCHEFLSQLHLYIIAHIKSFMSFLDFSS